MPRRDGTGPMGRGQMTGRGMGVCNTSRNLGCGMGYGCRSGFGRYASGYNTNSKDKKDILAEQKNIVEDRLNLIKQELEECERASSKK